MTAPKKKEFTDTDSAKEDDATPTATNNLNSPLHSTFPPISSDFILSSGGDDNGLLGDPQLFSVGSSELRPITTPFMMSGIYHGQGMGGDDSASTSTGARSALTELSNVFITTEKIPGFIMKRRDFYSMYHRAEDGEPVKSMEVDENNKQQLPDTLILNELPQDDCSQEMIRQPLVFMKKNPSVPKECDALSKLAYDVLKSNSKNKVVIDRKRNEVIQTESQTNEKTIYRLISPESLGLVPSALGNQEDRSGSALPIKEKPTVPNPKPKLGRPKKTDRPADGENQSKPLITSPMKRKRKAEDGQDEVATSGPEVRTRSGRLVKKLKTVEAGLSDAPESMRELLVDLNDKDYYRSDKMLMTKPPPLEEDSRRDTSPTHKRRVPPFSICVTCKKAFLGRRLQRHYAQHPDHLKPAAEIEEQGQQSTAANTADSKQPQQHASSDCGNEPTLFRFLLSKLQPPHLNDDQRADIFLNELNDLVEQLQARSSRLIRNTSGLHMVTKATARVLGIPEGQYALDMNAIEAPIEPEPAETAESSSSCLLSFENMNNMSEATLLPTPSVVVVNPRTLDYNNLSLDDTLTDEAAQKLNLSAGGKLLPPSEESLLRAVDDLVGTGIKSLEAPNALLDAPTADGKATSSLVSHYDHVSDNAVEAVNMQTTDPAQQNTPMLDLSGEFFQFNNN